MHFRQQLDNRRFARSPSPGCSRSRARYPPVRRQSPASHVRASRASNHSGLVQVVREATARFHDVEVAKSEGYGLLFGCVSGGDIGAMGLHFVNLALVGDPALDPTRPEIVIYEPRPNGGCASSVRTSSSSRPTGMR